MMTTAERCSPGGGGPSATGDGASPRCARWTTLVSTDMDRERLEEAIIAVYVGVDH